MALKFNNGYGALICDACSKMLAAGGDGSRPWLDVFAADRIEVPCKPRSLAFCKRACVERAAVRSDLDPHEHEACEAYLRATTHGGEA